MLPIEVQPLCARRVAERNRRILIYDISSDQQSADQGKFKELKSREMLEYLLEFSGIEPSSDRTLVKSSKNTIRPLRLRDLRRLDFQYNPNKQLRIHMRRNAVIFAIEAIRTIVFSSRLIFILPPPSEGVESTVMATTLRSAIHFMNDWFVRKVMQQEPVVSFELHAYYSVCQAAKEIQQVEYFALRDHTRTFAAAFRKHFSPKLSIQHEFHRTRDVVQQFRSRMISYSSALEVILNNEDSLAMMLLTPLRRKPWLYNYPLRNELLQHVGDVEGTLDPLLRDLRHMERKMGELQHTLHHVEAQMSLRLQTVENKAIVATVHLQMISAALLIGAYLSGLFGTNLSQVNPFSDEKDHLFVAITATTAVVMVLCYGGLLTGYPTVS